MIGDNDINTSEKNELIIRRRKKKFIKKFILGFVFLTSVLVILCLKHPYFNIKHIEVTGNKNILAKDIIKFSGISIKDNIFYLNMDKAISGIKSNPYVVEAQVKRKLPNNIVINIKERQAVFYSGDKNNFLIVDKNGVVLEKRTDIKGMKLVKLEGFDINQCKIGETISIDDERKLEAANTISSLIGSKKDNFYVSLVNIQDVNNIRAYYKNICIKLGDVRELKKKLTRAFNVLTQRQELGNSKGYIDVSFNGNPVIYIQK